MIDELLNQPWDKVAAMFGAMIAFLTLSTMIATRWRPAATWIGKPIKEMLGVNEINANLTRHAEKMDNYIETHAADVIEQNETIKKLIDLTSRNQDKIILASDRLTAHMRNNTRHAGRDR